jgi:DNA modification methylase
MSNIDILVGDAQHLPFPDGYFHCVVTSPPYWGLRDYGLGADSLGLESTPELYVQHLVEIFREVKRTLRDDGTLWLNIGDSYAGSGKGRMGDGTHAAKHGEKQHTNTGTLLGRLPHGFSSNELKPKDLVGIPWMVAFALRADGWYLRSDIIWHKPNVMPESVRDRPTKAHEYLFLLSKSEQYYYDKEAITEPTTKLARKCGKNSRANVDRDVSHGTRKQDAIGKGRYVGFNDRYDFANPSKKRNCRSVWNIAIQPVPGAHFAVFPEKLVEPCVLAGCPKGGVVLDLFAGSGTVGVVAQRLERNAVLIDAKTEYCEMAIQRCGKD